MDAYEPFSKLVEELETSLLNDLNRISNLGHKHKIERIVSAMSDNYMPKISSESLKPLENIAKAGVDLEVIKSITDSVPDTISLIESVPKLLEMTLFSRNEPNTSIPPAGNQVKLEGEINKNTATTNGNDDEANHTDMSPPEVSPAVSSSNSLPVNGNATPGDRGEESETINGSRGEVNREATTASGKESRTVTSGGTPSGMNSRNVTSSGVADGRTYGVNSLNDVNELERVDMITPLMGIRRSLLPLGIFTIKGNHLEPKLNVSLISNLIRSILLDLNDENVLEKLILGPQTSLRIIYSIIDNLLISGDVDDLLNKMSSKQFKSNLSKLSLPFEKLYEDIKDALSNPNQLANIVGINPNTLEEITDENKNTTVNDGILTLPKKIFGKIFNPSFINTDPNITPSKNDSIKSHIASHPNAVEASPPRSNPTLLPLAERSPPEVTTAVSTGRGASSNYLSLKSKATPGDRGSEEGRDVTSGRKPENDLREFEGELNREGTTPSGNGRNVTSGATANVREKGNTSGSNSVVNSHPMNTLGDNPNTDGRVIGIQSNNLNVRDNLAGHVNPHVPNSKLVDHQRDGGENIGIMKSLVNGLHNNKSLSLRFNLISSDDGPKIDNDEYIELTGLKITGEDLLHINGFNMNVNKLFLTMLVLILSTL